MKGLKALAISLYLPLEPSVLNPDPTAGPSVTPSHTPHSTHRDSEGVGLGEEQVPTLEVIVEVEESTAEGKRQEAVRPQPRPRPAVG